MKSSSRPYAARYSLKQSILALGETGYPFEKFVAAMLSANGFETEVGIIVKGKCVNHEVDVIAEKGNRHFMCECKFHNRQNKQCNVKVPLYIQARFKDVEASWINIDGHKNKFYQGWIVTNTRFTSDAMKYGNCADLHLVSWDSPKDNGIEDLMDRMGIHLVTCLTTLTRKEKADLIERDIILCLDLCLNPKHLTLINVSEKRQVKILQEANGLCQKGLRQMGSEE